jgi:RNA polymerase sigma-70 factor (ECF subfamily)
MRAALAGTMEDRDLMVRVVGGDVSAFEAIYDRHSDHVFALAMRVTGRRRAAEEAVQDVFLGLWRRAASYDPDRGALSTWLLAMVRNRSIDWLRREARYDRCLEIDDAVAERLEAADRTDVEVIAREESRTARQLLVTLPSDQRQVIELAYFNGLTHTEIAARLEIPLGTVKGRQRLALTKMRRKLTGLPELAPVA